MNINLLRENPAWWWFLVIALIMMVAVFFGWILFKYVRVCNAPSLFSSSVFPFH